MSNWFLILLLFLYKFIPPALYLYYLIPLWNSLTVCQLRIDICVFIILWEEVTFSIGWLQAIIYGPQSKFVSSIVTTIIIFVTKLFNYSDKCVENKQFQEEIGLNRFSNFFFEFVFWMNVIFYVLAFFSMIVYTYFLHQGLMRSILHEAPEHLREQERGLNNQEILQLSEIIYQEKDQNYIQKQNTKIQQISIKKSSQVLSNIQEKQDIDQMQGDQDNFQNQIKVEQVNLTSLQQMAIDQNVIRLDDNNNNLDKNASIQQGVNLNLQRNIEDKNQITKQNINISIDSKISNNRIDCSICLSDLITGDAIIRTPCKHIFHKECILSWIKQNIRCPNCRHNIREGIQKKIQEKHQQEIYNNNQNNNEGQTAIQQRLENFLEDQMNLVSFTENSEGDQQIEVQIQQEN